MFAAANCLSTSRCKLFEHFTYLSRAVLLLRRGLPSPNPRLSLRSALGELEGMCDARLVSLFAVEYRQASESKKKTTFQAGISLRFASLCFALIRRLSLRFALLRFAR